MHVLLILYELPAKSYSAVVVCVDNSNNSNTYLTTGSI